MDVVGYDVVGDDEDMDGEMVGRARGRMVHLAKKAGWRNQVLANGVNMPTDGLVPLALNPNVNGGVFNAANPAIIFTGRPQKPFRGERLVSTVSLTGGAAGQVQSTSIFVGTDLQQASTGNQDLSIYAPGSFGVRLCMKPAAPGIDIVINAVFVGVIGAGTAVTSLTILGRYIF